MILRRVDRWIAEFVDVPVVRLMIQIDQQAFAAKLRGDARWLDSTKGHLSPAARGAYCS
jgi:hypothetical protein